MSIMRLWIVGFKGDKGGKNGIYGVVYEAESPKDAAMKFLDDALPHGLQIKTIVVSEVLDNGFEESYHIALKEGDA